jgi:hypothetical protein
VKRLLFAVAVACLFAVSALAADPPVTTITPAPAPGTVIAPTPAVMSTTGTSSTRRTGLFSRLRNRMSGATYSTPTSGVIVAPSAPVVPGTPAPGIVPNPMPKPIEATSTGSGVVTASGAVVSGTTTTGAMVPMASTTSTRTRVGLLNRLRMRR